MQGTATTDRAMVEEVLCNQKAHLNGEAAPARRET